MSNHQFSRALVRILSASAVAASLTACGQSSVTEPQRAVHSNTAANHDDDPATCVSGYQVIDGRVVCN